ncbi:hypothetical protein BGZ99_007196 [Dissophora globulifera]|uniref:Nuclear fusion protein, KAR5 n=1 Tax=Dissophora globulifera TaxID=979702 RepID=A0A9P6RA34_9FUNG|nr:hypothetical protein BGZ99_007196 [Dissophora globulifera]
MPVLPLFHSCLILRLLLCTAAALIVASPCSSIFGWQSSLSSASVVRNHHLQHRVESSLMRRRGNSFNLADFALCTSRNVRDLTEDIHELDSSIWDNDAEAAQEFSIIRHAADALKAYDHKPNCFKKAARALRQDCKNIEMDENEKTKYAIRLTACEIATANIPVPSECRIISPQEENSSKEDGNESTPADIASCVQSLGRVPQLWTSYSGYFREVKVMCLVVRYSVEQARLTRFFHIAEDLRAMQRNLTRLHSDQLMLLREHRRVLLETHRLETERLQGIQDLHALGSVAQTIRRWHESLEIRVSRSEELDRLSNGLMSRIVESNAELATVLSNVRKTRQHVEDLTSIASVGTQSLLTLQDTAVREMDASISGSLSSMTTALRHVERDTQASWLHMIDTLKAESSDLQRGVATAMEATLSDIGTMASASQKRIEELNRVVEEFQSKQQDVIWQLQTLHRTWGLLTGMTEDKMSLVELVILSTIVGAIFLHSGIRATLLAMASTKIVFFVCEQLSVQTSFTQVFLMILIGRFVMLILKWSRIQLQFQFQQQHHQQQQRPQLETRVKTPIIAAKTKHEYKPIPLQSDDTGVNIDQDRGDYWDDYEWYSHVWCDHLYRLDYSEDEVTYPRHNVPLGRRETVDDYGEDDDDENDIGGDDASVPPRHSDLYESCV